MQDRFVKIMLVAIAALLAFNAFRPQASGPEIQLPSILSSAQAQSTTTKPPTVSTGIDKVRSLNGFSVEDLKEIVSLGDGKTFVVGNSKGFMVYQVNPSNNR